MLRGLGKEGPRWDLQSAEWDFRPNQEILGLSSLILPSGWLLLLVWPSESFLALC